NRIQVQLENPVLREMPLEKPRHAQLQQLPGYGAIGIVKTLGQKRVACHLHAYRAEPLAHAKRTGVANHCAHHSAKVYAGMVVEPAVLRSQERLTNVLRHLLEAHVYPLNGLQLAHLVTSTVENSPALAGAVCQDLLRRGATRESAAPHPAVERDTGRDQQSYECQPPPAGAKPARLRQQGITLPPRLLSTSPRQATHEPRPAAPERALPGARSGRGTRPLEPARRGHPYLTPLPLQ